MAQVGAHSPATPVERNVRAAVADMSAIAAPCLGVDDSRQLAEYDQSLYHVDRSGRYPGPLS
jgi:hypothetical protein